MTTINLKDFYYWYIQDQFIEVADEVAEALTASRRQEAAYVERFFGAATVDGSFDYIQNLTQTLSRRYFLKGRPGTGKSTFLKKIAAQARKLGYDTEAYRCALDPNSFDMVVVRELAIFSQ